MRIFGVGKDCKKEESTSYYSCKFIQTNVSRILSTSCFLQSSALLSLFSLTTPCQGTSSDTSAHVPSECYKRHAFTPALSTSRTWIKGSKATVLHHSSYPKFQPSPCIRTTCTDYNSILCISAQQCFILAINITMKFKSHWKLTFPHIKSSHSNTIGRFFSHFGQSNCSLVTALQSYLCKAQESWGCSTVPASHMHGCGGLHQLSPPGKTNSVTHTSKIEWKFNNRRPFNLDLD